MAAETTADRFRRVFDELDAEVSSCPTDLRRFEAAADADCVTVPGTFKQVRKAFRREFDQNMSMLNNWSREDGYRLRLVLGGEDVFMVVVQDAEATLVSIVPYRPCPTDPSVHSASEENFQHPKLVERVHPDAPAEAVQARQDGVALVRILIGEDGSVTDACPIEVVPPGYGFEQAAVRALRQWRFEPATVDGKAVSTYMINFVSWSIDQR
jgi:TonB family protein